MPSRGAISAPLQMHVSTRTCALPLRRGTRLGRAGRLFDGAVSSRQLLPGLGRARALSTPLVSTRPGSGVYTHRRSGPASQPALSVLTALAGRLRSSPGAASGHLVSAVEQLCASALPEAGAALVQVAAGISPKLAGHDKPLERALAAIGAILREKAIDVHAPLLAALKGFAALASAHTARVTGETAPPSVDFPSLAMALVSACLGPAGSHRSAHPLLSPDVATALLEVCASSRLPPALPLWAELGFRHHRLEPGSPPPLESRRLALNHAVVLARRRPAALERATGTFKDPTSPPRLRTALPVSPEAFLWQARGGVWLPHNDCLPPERVLEHRRLREGGAAEGQPRELTYLLRPAAEDAPVDVSAWFGDATASLEAGAAARSVGGAPPAVRLVPAGLHPAIDIPRDRSDALRFVAALWREVTGRVVHADGISEPASPAALPSPAFLAAAFRLCSRGADLDHLRALAAADGVPLEGPVLVLAVRQAVRYGDVPLAHAFVEDAALRALAATKTSPSVPVAAAPPSEPELQQQSTVGSEVAPDGLFAHVLGSAGVPRAAADALVAEAAAGGTPTGLPLPGAAAKLDNVAPPMAAVRDAYCELVEACAARPAAVQAVSAYYSMLQAGVAPSYRTVAAVVGAQAAIPLFEDVEASLAAVLEAFLSAVGPPETGAASSLFWAGSEEDARPDESGAPAACAVALAACVEAAGRLGSADKVRDAYARVVAALTERHQPLPARLAEAFIAALAADGPGAALDAATACARLGTRLTEAAVLPIIEAASSNDDVARAFAALRLMAAAGAEPTVLTETALIDLCVRVAHAHLPVPPELVEAARRESEERGIADAVRRALAGEAVGTAGAAAAQLSAAEEALEASLQRQSRVGNLVSSAARREARVLDAELADGAAPAAETTTADLEVVSASANSHDRSVLARTPTPVEALIRRYSVFNNSELGRAVVAVLRGRLFPAAAPAPAQHPPSGAATLVLAAQTARALCTGVIRGALQLVAAEAREAEAARSQGRTASDSSSPADEEGGDGDGDALDVSREMLVLALHEWPNTQAAYEAREARLASSTPQGRAATMRRQRGEALAARTQAATEVLAVSHDAGTASNRDPSGSKKPRYRTFEAMLRSSLGFGDFLAQLRVARAPLDAETEARQAHAHGGQIQRLPPAYGGFMLFKRLCPDEDGSGTLGREPVFPVRRPPPLQQAPSGPWGTGEARRPTAPARSVSTGLASQVSGGSAERPLPLPIEEFGGKRGAGAFESDPDWLASLEGGNWEDEGPVAGLGPVERLPVGGGRGRDAKSWNAWETPASGK